MKLADQLRIEKQNAVGEFNAVHFMELVEDYFKKHDYDKYLIIRGGDIHKTSPTICDGLFYVSYSKDYPSIDTIQVPTEQFQAAVAVLAKEGFNIFKESGREYEVLIKIDNTDCIKEGVHIFLKLAK